MATSASGVALSLAVGSALFLGTIDARGSRAGSPPLVVAVDGSDAGPCTSQAPCQSLDRAYRVAHPGDVVTIRAGSYPPQTIRYDSSKAGAARRVVFRPEGNARVVIGDELRVYAQHVEVDDLAMPDFYAGNNNPAVPPDQQARDLVFRNLQMRDGFSIKGASDVLVVGGEVGPTVDASAGAAQVAPCYGCSYPVTNVVIDSVRFHDVVRSPSGQSSGIHTECLHFWGGVNHVTVRDNRFVNCAIMDVYIENQPSAKSQGYVSDVLVENNFFDEPGSRGGPSSSGSYSLLFGPFQELMSRITVRFNTTLSTMLVDTANGPAQDAVFIGNYGYRPSWQCTKGVTFIHNVWSGARCSSTDRTGELSVLDRGHGDLHLSPSASAIGQVPAALAPRMDIDHQARPRAYPADAGADQREPASAVPGVSIGSMRLGESRGAIEAAYGVTTLHKRAPSQLQIGSYRVPGGSLWVAYAGDRAVEVGTTSSYYGYRIGATEVQGRWIGCRHVHVTKVRPGVRLLEYSVDRASPVTSLAMVQSRYVVTGC